MPSEELIGTLLQQTNPGHAGVCFFGESGAAALGTERMTIRNARWLLAAALLATFALYWNGLRGPFIFDDGQGLEMVRQWSAGKATWREVVFGDASLLFARPIPMASFLLTAWLTGDAATFGFKLGNLVLHLVCGYVAWCMVRRAFSFDEKLRSTAPVLASIATAMWLLHPLQVSTVLYSVQRMAQWSTLFALLATLTYLIARQQLEDGRCRAAVGNLFVSFPLLVVAGLLSKQNAAVAPLLCLAFELAYLARRPVRRPVAAFFTLFLGLPALGVVALLAFAPDKLLADYAAWDFTLGQRLLTQGRALMDYVGMLLLPRGPLMGLYTDDFPVSTSLFSPPSTAWSIVALIAITASAAALRKRAPSVLAGWLFFLGAHAVESTFLPIEMYYEHRNYLPSVGLLTAVVGLWALVPKELPTNVLDRAQLGGLAAGGFVLVLCIATLGRVLIWQDSTAIAAQGLQHHPNSLRANFHMADRALLQEDFDTHQRLMSSLVSSPDARNREVARLELINGNCQRGEGGNQALMQDAIGERLPRVTVLETYVFTRLSNSVRGTGCVDLSRADMANAMAQFVDAAKDQPESVTSKWATRYIVSQVYASAGMLPQATQQAEIAWQASGDKRVGIFLATLYITAGDKPKAEALLADLQKRINEHELGGQRALGALKQKIEHADRRPTAVAPHAKAGINLEQ